MSLPHESGNGKKSAINLRKVLTLFLIAVALLACALGFPQDKSQAKNSGRRLSNVRREANASAQARPSQSPNKGKETDDLWQDAAVSDSHASVFGDKPRTHRSLELNHSTLRHELAGVPLEFTEAASQKEVVISLPVPDGRLWRFQIQESPVMSQELAAKFPEIKTYSGQGVDEPSASMRFSWSPEGLSAFVISGHGSFMVAPASKGDPHHHLSYFISDVEMKQFECLTPGAGTALTDELTADNTASLLGGVLHEYRIAINVTPQFFSFAGNNPEATNSTIVILLNSVNAIYQREAAIRFTLAGWVLDTRGFLPHESQGAQALATANQAMTDFVSPQAADHDVGHALGFLPNAPSGFGMFDGVCNTSLPRVKAMAASIVGGSLVQDTMLFTHELGHQLGARHTFTPVVGRCTVAADPIGKYEPASGSTIMSYAGVCAPEDLQPASDAYFHASSLLRIKSHIDTFPPCGTQTSTGNAPPVINSPVGVNANIPAKTPFTLTADATDPNGDTILYAWEQFDLNTALFRSFVPTSSASRTFPNPFFILSFGNEPPLALNGFLTGEALPTTTRTMTFTVTARDIRAAGGGTAVGQLQVFVRGEAGPFAVTQPNTPVAWAGASQRTITWNVANTNVAPINTANVRILLSTDGGSTFPTVLAASTPNDGSEIITLPNVQTLTARIKVEAVGNIYFDVSNTNFTINQVAGPVSRRKTAGVFRPTNGIVYLKNSNSGGVADLSLVYGIAGDIPIAGDWDGDGVDSVGIYRNGVFYLRNSNTTGPANVTFPFGAPGDLPVAGDWNGDGVDTVGVYRPTTGVFFLRNSNSAGTANVTFVLGNPGDVPIAGDWNGDGITTTGVFRPTNGIIYLKNSNVSGNAEINLVYGNAGDRPLAGDWDGDGVDSVGIYRGGLFYLRNSNTQGFADLVFALGNPGDVPIAGDWDGLP